MIVKPCHEKYVNKNPKYSPQDLFNQKDGVYSNGLGCYAIVFNHPEGFTAVLYHNPEANVLEPIYADSLTKQWVLTNKKITFSVVEGGL